MTSKCFCWASYCKALVYACVLISLRRTVQGLASATQLYLRVVLFMLWFAFEFCFKVQCVEQVICRFLHVLVCLQCCVKHCFKLGRRADIGVYHGLCIKINDSDLFLVEFSASLFSQSHRWDCICCHTCGLIVFKNFVRWTLQMSQKSI